MLRSVASIRCSLFLCACLSAAACDDAPPDGGGDAQSPPHPSRTDADAATPLDGQLPEQEGAPLDSSPDAHTHHRARPDGGVEDASVEPDARLVVDATKPPACDVAAPTSCPMPAPRYADVAPVFASRCTICHGQVRGGPWPLDSYEHVADWTDEIRAELVACTMPPADAGVPMTTDERRLVLDWLRCGLPR